jgi:hypothetical protein
MAITKPIVVPAWADSGNKQQPTNTEIDTGWPLSSTPPSRQRFNWILNYLSNAVRYFMRRGICDFDVAETYDVGDVTRGPDSVFYKSLVAANINNIPATSPTKWATFIASQTDVSSAMQSQTGTYFTTSGTAPNFAVAPSPAPAALAIGLRFNVSFHAAGAGADKVNVNGLGFKFLKQYDHQGIKQPAVVTLSQLADIEYDGTDFVILNALPKQSSSPADTTNAVAAEAAIRAAADNNLQSQLTNLALTTPIVTILSVASLSIGQSTQAFTAPVTGRYMLTANINLFVQTAVGDPLSRNTSSSWIVDGSFNSFAGVFGVVAPNGAATLVSTVLPVFLNAGQTVAIKWDVYDGINGSFAVRDFKATKLP